MVESNRFPRTRRRRRKTLNISSENWWSDMRAAKEPLELQEAINPMGCSRNQCTSCCSDESADVQRNIDFKEYEIVDRCMIRCPSGFYKAILPFIHIIDYFILLLPPPVILNVLSSFLQERAFNFNLKYYIHLY